MGTTLGSPQSSACGANAVKEGLRDHRQFLSLCPVPSETQTKWTVFLLLFCARLPIFVRALKSSGQNKQSLLVGTVNPDTWTLLDKETASR